MSYYISFAEVLAPEEDGGERRMRRPILCFPGGRRGLPHAGWLVGHFPQKMTVSRQEGGGEDKVRIEKKPKLNLTSEFNEVYFSEMGEAEATHSRDPRKINLGGETCKVSEPLNSCYILPLGIDF